MPGGVIKIYTLLQAAVSQFPFVLIVIITGKNFVKNVIISQHRIMYHT